MIIFSIMDFIKFQKINNHSNKNIFEIPNFEESPLLNKKDFTDKENFEIKSANLDYTCTNNNLNHKAKTNILNSEVDYSNSNFNYSNNACSINNNTNCKDLDEIIKKRNRRVSIRDKINYFEAQKEESKILHNLVERLKQDSSLSGIASNYQFLIY